ncbi:MAG: rhodanese-like domain-containing protein [Anaerovibrio sp.]|uniref:rhodanese-like domain-containing protein n=1 Tax=Anaerovibrio sp. TaxID=1872532 RepID=UPI0025F94E12|nr:rhodanese-like domain-containing protein [Anaerovibrio sp.]MCR5175990.1 rhodanese-like domain-containing protein [Anaerovibrio sp.]
MKITIAVVIVAVVLVLLGCGHKAVSSTGDDSGNFRQVSSDEGRRLMAEGSGYIIVDVRTRQEYDNGHIPKAICIPNESIDQTPPDELKDKNQEIFVYCRSGRRSKQAAQKLANMGYTNIIEFGGINDWRGEITTEK